MISGRCFVHGGSVARLRMGNTKEAAWCRPFSSELLYQTGSGGAAQEGWIAAPPERMLSVRFHTHLLRQEQAVRVPSSRNAPARLGLYCGGLAGVLCYRMPA